MVPRKVVLPVGGWGTRFLPITKTIPKAMLPIMSKPIIHYAIDEVIAAGIEHVIIVISPNSWIIEDYFSPCVQLEVFLKQRNKTDAIAEVSRISNMASFSFTPAQLRGQYRGLGVGVLNAKTLVGEEPFAVVLPNDMLETSIPCMKSLVAIYNVLRCPVFAVHRVPVARLSTYGNVKVEYLDDATAQSLPEQHCDGARVWEVTQLIQKPNPERHEHLSDLAIIGRFILPADVFSVLEVIPPGYEGEVQLIDALEELRQQGQRIYAYEFAGRYFDTRSERGYVEAILNEAAKKPCIWSAIREVVSTRGT